MGLPERRRQGVVRQTPDLRLRSEGQYTNPGNQAETETQDGDLALPKGDKARPRPQKNDEQLGGTASTAGEISR